MALLFILRHLHPGVNVMSSFNQCSFSTTGLNIKEMKYNILAVIVFTGFVVYVATSETVALSM